MVFYMYCHSITNQLHNYYLFKDSDNVALTHDEIFLAHILDFLSGILAIEDIVTDLENHLFILLTFAYCNDSAL